MGERDYSAGVRDVSGVRDEIGPQREAALLEAMLRYQISVDPSQIGLHQPAPSRTPTQQTLAELGRQLRPLTRTTTPFDLPVPRQDAARLTGS